jgi:hypothetical protein
LRVRTSSGPSARRNLPAADPAHKSHPAIEKLVAGGRSAGHGDAVGSGGVVLTLHQAGKVIRRPERRGARKRPRATGIETAAWKRSSGN